MKIIKRVFLIAAILVGVAFIADFAILNPLLERKLQKSLQNMDVSQIDFSEIRCRFLTGTVKIKDVYISSLKPDADSGSMKIRIGEIKFSRINFVILFFRQEIRIGKIKISGCHIDADNPFPKDSTAPLIADRKVTIGSFQIETDTVRIKNIGDFGEVFLSGCNLEFSNIHIMATDTISLKNSGTMKFDLAKTSLLSEDGNITYLFYHSSYDSGRIMIDSIHLRPNFPDYAFTNRFAMETDRIEAIFKGIGVQDIDIRGLSSGNLICSFVALKSADIRAFRDKRKDASHEVRATFQDAIRNYPGNLSIDSIYVSDGSVIYSEHADDAAVAGHIAFTMLRMKVFNIANNAKLRNSGITLSVFAEARLMDSGHVKIELNTPLFDTNNTIFVKGSLGKFSIDELNPMLANHIFVKGRGTLDSMNFRFLADNHRAIGEIEMAYHNLHLTASGIEGNDSIKLKERIKTTIANLKVIDSNPLPGNPLREGVIGYERDPRKFIFNYCFKSILSGIKSTILVNPPSKIQE